MPASQRPTPPRVVPRPKGQVVELAERVTPAAKPLREALKPPPVPSLPHSSGPPRTQAPSDSGSAALLPPTRAEAPESGQQALRAADTLPPSSGRRRERISGTTGFAAAIDGASIADLVQLECLRGLTRAIRVFSEGLAGVLYFDQGQLVHAETGDLVGEEAALSMLCWASGHVEACGEYWLESPTIQTSWQGMLIMAATRADERTRAGSYDDADDGAETIWLDDESLAGTFPPESVLPAGLSHAQRAQDARAWSEARRAVRLDANGAVVSAKGSKAQVSQLSEAIAYSVLLAQVIGEGLGLEDFRGFECAGRDHHLVTYVEGDCVVAVEAVQATQLAEHRKKAGV